MGALGLRQPDSSELGVSKGSLQSAFARPPRGMELDRYGFAFSERCGIENSSIGLGGVVAV